MGKPIIIEEPDVQETYYSICCGIDVHQKTAVACLLRNGKKKEIRQYGTSTRQLEELAHWLKQEKCEMVAMESTGVYWRSLYNIFEKTGIEAMVVNAAHMKNVPGKKSDIGDAQWIAHLLKQGLLKKSFIPEREQRELRDLTRFRAALVQEKSRYINRLQKQLEVINIKLKTQLSDINGKTSRELIDCILQEHIPTKEELLEMLPTKKMKANVDDILMAIEGDVSKGEKLLLRQILNKIDEAEADIQEVNQIIEELMEKDKALVEALDEIPGVGQTSAEIILAEIGTDMEQFPSSEQLTAWAGVSPTKNESGGKKKAIDGQREPTA